MDDHDIIDNKKVTMSAVINDKLPDIEYLDVSSGYFEISGYVEVKTELDRAVDRDGFSLRLLLGKNAISLPNPGTFERYRKERMRELGQDTVSDLLGEHQNMSLWGTVNDRDDLTIENMGNVADLLGLLRRDNVQVRHNDARFNHAKCYVLGSRTSIIGSSNFTGSGLSKNRELNAGLYQPSLTSQVREWFEDVWKDATDAKAAMIRLLEQSKFGVPPDPHQVYIKMLFERYKESLLAMDKTKSLKDANLAEFQKDAVVIAVQILENYKGVIIADSTGLGKTHMGIEIIRQKRHVEKRKVLLVAPAQVLKTVWHTKLNEEGINIRTISMESLGREEFDEEIGRYTDIETVVIDESQNFRSRHANRRINLMRIMSIGRPKRAVLLSATPINNGIMDLYYQISIITNGDDTYFADIGIPNLYKHMRDAANKGIENGLDEIQLLLDTIMVRRTRAFIKEAYPNEKLNGKPVKFPTREYDSIRYNLVGAIGTDIFAELIDTIEQLRMVPYGIETYNNTLTDAEREKHRALASLQTTLILKRFESSTYAAKRSIDNKIRLYERFQAAVAKDAIIPVRVINKVLQKWNRSHDYSDDEGLDEFLLDEIRDADAAPAKDYDLERMRHDIEHDLEILRKYGRMIEEEALQFDKKFEKVAEQIHRDKALKKESGKVLVFTEYTDTATHVRESLEKKFDREVLLITGRTDPDTRQKIIRRFSPKANASDYGEPVEDGDGASILVSTEVLAEGQNLQDCNYVVNYDLPWNPMRIVQRMGRIDRLTSEYDTVHSRECFPDDSLDRLLSLMAKLYSKIDTINKTGLLDTAILDTIPTPKQFNGTDVKRIEAFADKNVSVKALAAEMEKEMDMMPASNPLNVIKQYMKDVAIEDLLKIPMGRRSGKQGEGNMVILAYVREKGVRQFHTVAYDYVTGKAEWVDFTEAFNMVSCTKDTTKHLPMDEDEYHGSFTELVRIDEIARRAVIERNAKDHKTAAGLGQSPSSHRKNVEKVQKILMDAMEAGKISEESVSGIYNTIALPKASPWEGRIKDCLADYDIKKDVEHLVSELKGIRGLGLVKDDASMTTDIVEDSELTLVGAMFITDGKADLVKHMGGSRE